MVESGEGSQEQAALSRTKGKERALPKAPLFDPSSDDAYEPVPDAPDSPSDEDGEPEVLDDVEGRTGTKELEEGPPSTSTRSGWGGRRGKGSSKGAKPAPARGKKTLPSAGGKTVAEVAVPSVRVSLICSCFGLD